jgi:hypothetical protein
MRHPWPCKRRHVFDGVMLCTRDQAEGAVYQQNLARPLGNGKTWEPEWCDQCRLWYLKHGGPFVANPRLPLKPMKGS